MNRYNDWQVVLKYANEDLEKFGFSILIVEPEKGCYNCEIWGGNELVETYAENFYEDELCLLITDAALYIKKELV